MRTWRRRRSVRSGSEGGASTRVTRVRDRLANYLGNHRHILLDSLLRMRRTPLATGMTLAVIGIAFALPTSLHMLLGAVEQLGLEQQMQVRLSVYLQQPDHLDRLNAQVADMPGVAAVTAMSPELALAEFERWSGLGDVLAELEDNPLPALLIVKPSSDEPAPVQALKKRLESLPGVDSAVLDLDWLQRLTRLRELIDRAVVMLFAASGLGVALVIGNTVRLAIAARRAEVEVIRLVGATDRFVRRPFLYSGLWFGIGGALLGWLMVQAAALHLQGAVDELLQLYGGSVSLRLPLSSGLALLATGGGLGVGAAWLVTARTLREFDMAR